MHGYRRISIMALVVGLTVTVGWAQGPSPRPQTLVAPQVGVCLHEGAETAIERQRREEALAAVRLTNQVVGLAMAFRVRPGNASYPSWDEVAVAGVRMGRMDGGQMGRLARQLQWGADDLLPGWRVHYIADRNGYAFSLADSRDLCGWTYFSDERGLVAEGHTLDAPERVVPIESQ